MSVLISFFNELIISSIKYSKINICKVWKKGSKLEKSYVWLRRVRELYNNIRTILVDNTFLNYLSGN